MSFSKPNQYKKQKQIDETSVIYLQVPFDLKDQAKENGCKWDSEKKLWYSPTNYETDYDEFVSKYRRINLTELFENKKLYDVRETLKKYNCCWDSQNKEWYSYEGNDELLDFLNEREKL